MLTIRTVLFALLLVAAPALPACSLLVDFDPAGLQCGNLDDAGPAPGHAQNDAGTCLEGYHCDGKTGTCEPD